MRIASVVGARPNFVKLAPIYRSTNNFAEHLIIHTGQHYDYEMSEIFFKEFDLPKPDINLEIGSGTAGFQLGEMIKKLEAIFLSRKFDLVIVYGDTNSTFTGALAANKVGVKTAHVEAGLRSYDRRMPEEINRILTDQLCDYLFAPTESSIDNLRMEHVAGRSYNTGDISVEIIARARRVSDASSRILENQSLSPKSYYLFTMHRAENTNDIENLTSIIRSFELLRGKTIVFPVHPRTKKIMIETGLWERLQKLPDIKILQPVGYIDFIKLLSNAERVITDSGGIQKESYLLQVPCITIRKSTEWIETVKEGWNFIVGTDPKAIVEASTYQFPVGPQKAIFGSGKTSETIRNLILTEILGQRVAV